jgi:type VI secretion system secreted protein Hcp
MFRKAATRLIRSTLLGLATFAATGPALSAYEFYVSVEGTKQGKIKGESTRNAYKDTVVGTSFSYRVQVPRDTSSGLATGRRQHSLVCFTKNTGAATPQFFTALTTNELLKSVVFQFTKTSTEGSEFVDTTIRLTNATVVSFEIKAGDANNPSALTSAKQSPQYEEVCFSFQRIEITNATGKTSAADEMNSKS